MKSIQFSCNSLPLDIILKIGSSLQVIDLCALSSCSKFWRELCGSDILWESLFRERWPLLGTFDADSDTEIAETDDNSQEWKRLYMMQHNEMASRVSEVIAYVTKWPATLSLESSEYLHAVETMKSMQLSFQDVEFFIFKPNLSVMLNLIGLIYCLQHLKKPLDTQILDAFRRYEICEQLVWVKWWTLGRWCGGRRMRDETVSRRVSLLDLVTGKDEIVLRVLKRGVIHEVLRVCVSSVDLACTPCSSSTIRNY